MDMTLTRSAFDSDGVFGTLTSGDGKFTCVTCEHAFDSGLGNGSYAPKVPAGTYVCQRSMHRLENMTTPFETFQIMKVPNHTNILIHVGNFNSDSDGCVLLGHEIDTDGMRHMITESRITFNNFMALQSGEDTFILLVKDGE